VLLVAGFTTLEQLKLGFADSDSTGMPLKKLVMPLICHPPSAPFTKAWEAFLKNGRS
jgi:hypothetical protein